MDIKGLPSGEVILHNSNPASLYYSPGGVARNIAENLGRLNIPTKLLGAVGTDPMGEQVLTKTAEAGVDVQFAKRQPGYSTGVDISFLNNEGDLYLAYCDMKVVETVDVSYLQAHQRILEKSRYIIADANIPGTSLAWLAEWAFDNHIPLIIEPSSFQLATKLHHIQKPVFLITPNEKEWKLINRAQPFNHYQNLLITQGSKGVSLYNQSESKNWEAFPTKASDVIGAGDALVAGIAYGLFKGLDLQASIPFGLAVGALTVQAQETVNPNISEDLLEKLILKHL